MREIQVVSGIHNYRALSFTRDNEITIASYHENNDEINVHAYRDLVYKKQWCSVWCLAVLSALSETRTVHSSEMDLSHL